MLYSTHKILLWDLPVHEAPQQVGGLIHGHSHDPGAVLSVVLLKQLGHAVAAGAAPALAGAALVGAPQRLSDAVSVEDDAVALRGR